MYDMSYTTTQLHLPCLALHFYLCVYVSVPVIPIYASADTCLLLVSGYQHHHRWLADCLASSLVAEQANMHMTNVTPRGSVTTQLFFFISQSSTQSFAHRYTEIKCFTLVQLLEMLEDYESADFINKLYP